MAATAVNGRWQAEMAPFFVDLRGRRPDEGLALLEEVFHLEDQLAALDPGKVPGEERPAER
jgi:L-rhamnose mutarotase